MVVMMIPIVCAIFAYIMCYSLISEEIKAANSLALVSAKSAIDSRLSKMQELSISILRDTRFREVALSRNTEQERHWKVAQAMELLFNHRTSLNMDIFV